MLINALPAITNTANVTLTDVVIDDPLKTIGPEDPVPSSPVDSPPADADTPLPATPGIELVKTSALNGEAVAGEAVDYGFVATNTGTVSLSEVSIVDPRPGLSNLSFAWPGEAGTLAPRESVEASAALAPTQDHVSLTTRQPQRGTTTGAQPGPADAVISQEKSAEYLGEGEVGDTVTHHWLSRVHPF
ncbi:hypothetical protein [Yaniella sp.]|uniref:DUF7507 domain-containing protein n=1 Tax=Yaniella sp. TaxID=2773929 RepID=UPI002647CEF1|nr:hypothetical protein [Yaniella sp.]MDN5816694.1 hypothetical protein [Yaniella sp.]